MRLYNAQNPVRVLTMGDGGLYANAEFPNPSGHPMDNYLVNPVFNTPEDASIFVYRYGIKGTDYVTVNPSVTP